MEANNTDNMNEANENTLKLLKNAISTFVKENKGKGVIGNKVFKFIDKDINDVVKEIFKHLVFYIDKKF